MRPRDSRGVTPASYRDQWVIEGLAHYTTVIANRSILEQARDLLLGESPEGKPYDVLGPVWIGFRMEQPRATPAYQALLRSKSIWIMHMLRHVIQRDEKDASFARFLDDILKEYGGKSISTYDVKRLAEKHAAKPLDWFFDAWVFGTGIPNYKLEYKLDSAGDGFVVSGNMTQTGVPDTFEVPVPLYADDTLLGMVTVSSAGGEFRFTTRAKPQQILIDPKGTILTAK